MSQVGADRGPPVVGGDVIDPVGVGLAQCRVGEGVDVGAHRITGRAPGLPAVGEEADEFLFLRIDADHRLHGGYVLCTLVVEVSELGPVDVDFSFDLLRVALQVESLPLKQVRHCPGRDPVPRPIEFVGRGPGGLCGPAQRRHRIPTLLRFHPGQQGIEQTRIGECPLLADLAVLQFHHVLGDRDRAGPGGSGNRRKPGMAQRPDLRPQRQPALIQMGRQRLKLRLQLP